MLNTFPSRTESVEFNSGSVDSSSDSTSGLSITSLKSSSTTLRELGGICSVSAVDLMLVDDVVSIMGLRVTSDLTLVVVVVGSVVVFIVVVVVVEVVLVVVLEVVEVLVVVVDVVVVLMVMVVVVLLVACEVGVAVFVGLPFIAGVETPIVDEAIFVIF